jgi:tetratricopeptide (TPR) repeat protein
VVVLVGAAGAYLATRSWRQRLWTESARSRQVIAAAEQARVARERSAARQQELTAALVADPENVEARLELAQLRWAEAGPRAAAEILQSPQTSPLHPRLARLLASAQRLMGREDQALATLDAALRGGETDPPGPRTAIHKPQSAVERTEYGNLHVERAMLFSLLGWFPQAREALQQAMRWNADPLQVGLVRVTMARQQADLRTAKRELEVLRRDYPGDGELVRQGAAVAEAAGDLAGSIQQLETLAAREPDVQVWLSLARLYLRQSGPASVTQAKAAVERALALRPDLPAARRLQGRCLRLEGQLSEARAVLEALEQQQPRSAGVAFELAQLYRDLGMPARAAPLLKRHQEALRRRGEMRRAALSVMTHPHSARAHREMGRLCLEQGMIGRAILSLERARMLDPRLPGVVEALERARLTDRDPDPDTDEAIP